MRSLIASIAFAAVAASAASAQPVRQERDVVKQRAALEYWTACIADEKADDVKRTLARDFNSADYRREIRILSETRVSSRCFADIPGEYRRIRLGGLPFAGGLAERLIEQGDETLLLRLSRAVVGAAPQTYSATDAVAMCVVRGAPQQVANLFATPINTAEETAALAAITPAANICAGGEGRFEASALGMRSMLATASFRLLEGQEN